MNWVKGEKTFIEIKDKLFCFYRNEDKILVATYIDNKVQQEKIIIEECKTLNSVILGSDEKVTLIVTNSRFEMYLYVVKEEEIETKILLTKSIPEAKYMEIASVNNSLNIFYINEINNISALCFRVINNKLALTPSIVIDSIDNKGEVPFRISVNNGKLFVSYLRTGNPNVIGYRKFDFVKNSWSNFIPLDNCFGQIKDFQFTTINKTIAYSYIYYKQKKAIMSYGIGEEGALNKGTITENESSIIRFNMELNLDNNMKISYILNKFIKIKEIDGNAELKSSEEVELDSIENVNKCRYFAIDNPSINEILIVKTDDDEILVNRIYIIGLSIKKYKESLGINKYIESEGLFTEVEVDTEIDFDSEESEIIIDKGILKELKLKVKTYEEMLKRVSENILLGEEEKKKLLANIDYLTEQLNKKNYTISAFEKAFTERQAILVANEKRIVELNEAIRNNQLRANSSEISKLREIVNANEIQSTSYKNEIKVLNMKIEELNLLLKNKNEEVTNLAKSYDSLQSQSSLKITQLKELININNIEKNNYTSEINDIRNINVELNNTIAALYQEKNNLHNQVKSSEDKLQEQALILQDNLNQINLLQNQIVFLEEKNKESFIKKLFKAGE